MQVFCGSDKGIQLSLVAHHGGTPYAVELFKVAFDFPQFDTVTIHLHLGIVAPQKGDLPVSKVAPAIPSAVNSLTTRFAPDKARRRFLCVVQVALCQPHPANANLSFHPDRTFLQLRI